LDGRTSPLETAIALCRHHDAAVEPEALREALLAFVAVASETDAIPVGGRRAFWHPDVREREDLKHDAAQAWAYPIVEEACTRILAVNEADASL
jgi:hypothetical protein